MSLFFMDGFDHYDGLIANTQLGNYLSAANNALTTTRFRNGTHSIRGTSSGNGELIIALPGLRQVAGIGFGYWQDSAGDSQKMLVAFTNDSGSTSGINYNVYISVLASGAIEVRRSYGSGTLLGTSAPGVIVYSAWNHIEVRAVASNTVGQVQVRVNGIEVLNLTNLDTVHTGTDNFASIHLNTSAITGTNGSGNTRYYDDLFCWDGLGSVNNDFIGDKRVTILNPSDNTAVAEWSVTGAATPVSAINGTNDGDTSYISAGDSVPVTSEFEIDNPDSSIGLIAGIQTVLVGKKVLSGTAIILPSLVVSSSATDNGSHSFTDSYAYFNKVHELNPNTGMPWTSSALANTRLRLRRTT